MCEQCENRMTTGNVNENWVYGNKKINDNIKSEEKPWENNVIGIPGGFLIKNLENWVREPTMSVIIKNNGAFTTIEVTRSYYNTTTI